MIAEIDVVGGAYLQALGVRLSAGRWFREEEMKESNESAIVNDIAATKLWPGSNAIGQQLCVNCTPENPRNWKRVIGVVSSIRHAALDGPLEPDVYLAPGALESASFLIVRTNRPIGEMDKAVRRAIAAVDPDQPVLLSTSMQALIADTFSDGRFIMCLLALTGYTVLCRDLRRLVLYHLAQNAGNGRSDGAWGHSRKCSCADLPPTIPDGYRRPKQWDLAWRSR